jgi:3-methyl-2-oxobutanoate hydroxymethyltransferase
MTEKIKNIINKKNKTKIVCLTAYSKNQTSLIDKYCDIILVGDSLANVLYGMNNTHKINLDIMIRHAISVKSGINRSLLVVDMPKGTYSNIASAKKNAKLLISKTKCDAIKIESNNKNSHIIKGLVKANINVMGHIGYTPQYKSKFEVQGKSLKSQSNLIKEAKKIEQAGAFSIVLECITSNTSKEITKKLKIPTIGIGSSVFCDGQILVTDDLLGLSGFYPKFVKKYANISKIIKRAVNQFRKEVKTKKFPTKKNYY